MNCTCFESMDSLFVDLDVQVNSVIILGDVNINLMSNVQHGAKFLRCLLKNYNAVQGVSEPTRVISDSETLLITLSLTRQLM